MRALIILALLAGTAHAEEVALVDFQALQLAESQAREAQLRVELVATQLRAKYAIGPDDRIDEKRVIHRAAKTAAKK